MKELKRLRVWFMPKRAKLLKNVRHCSNNSAVNNIKMLKTATKVAVENKFVDFVQM